MLPIVPHFFLVLGPIIVGLAIKSSSARPLFFILALSIYLCIFITPHPDADPLTRSHIGIAGSSVLAVALDLLVLQPNPQDDIMANNQDKPASQLGFLSRLKWSASLLFNIRGVNWNCAVRGLRFPQYKSRWGFVLSQILWACIYYLISDVVGAITRRNPAFQYPPTEGLSTRGFGRQVANVVLFWMTLGGFMLRNHTFCSAVLVAFGVTEPGEWPTFFGDWRNARSVRTFWGRTWHQCLRRVRQSCYCVISKLDLTIAPQSIQPQAKYFAKQILHVKHNGLSPYVELFTCFFLSGLYHAAGDWLVLRNLYTALQSIIFFASQAVIITLEDALTFVGRKAGMKQIPRIVSYAWIVSWMAVSSAAWIETIVAGDNFAGFLPMVSLIEISKDSFAYIQTKNGSHSPNFSNM